MTASIKNDLSRAALCVAVAALVAGAATTALAQDRDERGGPAHPARPEHVAPARPGEPHPGPNGYQRPEAPHGWDTRPKQFDRAQYQHNFQAARAYHVGPYHRPSGWVNRHWVYGQMLPRPYWTTQYLLADYWLFGLEVPPVNYEWVRVGDDALMIDVGTGQILQVEYGVFG